MASSQNFMFLNSIFMANYFYQFQENLAQFTEDSSSSYPDQNSHPPLFFKTENIMISSTMHVVDDRSSLILDLQKGFRFSDSKDRKDNGGVAATDNGRRLKREGRKESEGRIRKSSVIRGRWSQEEDSKLKNLVRDYGKNWSYLAKTMGNRVGKQCRERWYNHLQPNIKKEAWTEEELQTVIKLHKEYGNRWADIARAMPGRTENSVKNLWNSTKRKQRAGVHLTLRQYIETTINPPSIKNEVAKFIQTPNTTETNKFDQKTQSNELDFVNEFLDLSSWEERILPTTIDEESRVDIAPLDQCQEWATKEMNFLKELLP